MGGRHRARAGARRRPDRILARLAVGVFALAVIAGGLFVIVTESAGPSDGPHVAAPAPTLDDPALGNQEQLRVSFDRLDLPAPVGLALVPVGGGTPLLLGDQTPHDAWSTIKVPVALAAERLHGANRAESRALVDSDNRSARILMRSLGDPAQAAAAVTEVLREGHSTTTVQRAADGQWPQAGETVWPLADSATWTAHLPCLAGSAHILELMSHVGPTQDWGLQQIPGDRTAVKGGWGRNDDDSGYVVRQIGLITLDDGRQVAVSMSAHAPGMTFDTGGAALNGLGRWLGANLALLPAGRCPTATQ
ncbi:hypothetical protein GOHSU_16_00180 [Gordonia hirsuta DSM 44140 = NBRC 16056]|uniref:Beta-lactamase n=1 Tax=Gordonia hirsuta DSM 44140 = NBRC 16056 TaxID=1121927 RepID=L7L8K0_9ACTN|nr:hypothetical protein [Gordonia hirsuta]GAC57061.1 hypothetical protein GOHSU_16_00180 [Gordonia hirsuta DSM 44140 = NBRC 16056]